MSTTDATSHSADTPSPQPGDMRMEVLVIPVSDVDRANEFYGRLGRRLDADLDRGELRLLRLPGR